MVGVHDRPAVQALHAPLSQTRLVPHEVPLGALLPVSVQASVVQLMVPRWHTLAGVQALPLVHDTHEPLWQTRLVPQVVPLGTLPDALHTELPVAQEVTPV